MAPRLRGGPAVEWLPLQAFATGGGGAYPCHIHHAMAETLPCQAELTIAVRPLSFLICQFSLAQIQIS